MRSRNMKLINLTEEQNEQLRKMHVKAINWMYELNELENKGFSKAEYLGLIAFAQAKAYLELGDFEEDPRLQY